MADQTADAGISSDEDGGEETRRARVDRRNQQLSTELRELRIKLDEYKQADAERSAEDERLREEQERAAGEWAKIEERLNAKLADKDKAIAERDSLLEARTKADREAKLLDSIVALSGVEASRSRLKGLLRIAKEEHGLDTAPEEITKDTTKHALGVLKDLDRETFEPRKPGGGTPGTVGTSTAGGRLGEIRARIESEGWTDELKAAYSAELNRGPPRE